MLAPVPTLVTTLELILPTALDLGDDELPTLATNATTVEVMVSVMILNLKREEMPIFATTVEGSDSNAAACITTTNCLRPTHPTINVGQDSPQTPTRPTTTNAVEMPSRPGMRIETSSCPMLPPTRPTPSAWLAHPLL